MRSEMLALEARSTLLKVETRWRKLVPLEGQDSQVLLVLLGLALVLRVTYALITPSLAGPDEDGHLDYVQMLCDTKGDRSSSLWASKPAPYNSERSQPSTYYWLVSPGYALTHDQPQAVQVVGVRLVSLLLSLGEVVLAYLTARLLFPTNRFVYLSTAAMVALLPGRAWMASVINNDNLACLMGAAVVYLLVRCHRRPFGARFLLLAGAVLLIALGSKSTVLAVVAVAGPAIAVKLVTTMLRGRHRAEGDTATWTRFRGPLVGVAIAVVVLALISLGQMAGNPAVGVVVERLSSIASDRTLPVLQPTPFVHQWKSFWLPLWVEDYTPPDAVYYQAAIFSLLAAVGLVVRVLLRLAFFRRLRTRRGEALIITLLALVPMALWMVSFVRLLTLEVVGTVSLDVPRDVWPSTHARFLFPGLLPIAYFVALGIDRFLPPQARRGALLLSAAFFLYLNGVGILSLVMGNYW